MILPTKDFAKPGTPLAFVDRYKKAGRWPLSLKEHQQYITSMTHGEGKRPTATPYLVIPAYNGDTGDRTGTGDAVLFSQGVGIFDDQGQSVITPVAGKSYSIRCCITNLGVFASYGGMVEFYFGEKDVFDKAAVTPGVAMLANGYAGFTLLPGASLVVECPRKWTPQNAAEAGDTMLVRAFDPFIDPLVHPFDARLDRHIGRRDSISDFSGTWEGMESGNVIHMAPTKIRITIEQNALQVDARFYMQLSGVIPANPQETASVSIANGQVEMESIEFWGPAKTPFTRNHWTLTKPTADVLHFVHQKHYLMSGDKRPDTVTEGDLHRI